MTNLNKFAAQQMNTQQMNNVMGGAQFAIYADGQLCCWVEAKSLADASAWAQQTYGSDAYAQKW